METITISKDLAIQLAEYLGAQPCQKVFVLYAKLSAAISAKKGPEIRNADDAGAAGKEGEK